MLKLLREHQVAPEFRKALKRASKGYVAVPFWGDGAVTTLGLSKGLPIRVICNLDHPGCNPDAIEKVHGLGIKVRSHPRLHAKIYIVGPLAIVGSSNVSTNGLTVEGTASKGWVEANVACDDPGFVSNVQDLFDTLWDDPETRSVRPSDIKAAKKRRADWPLFQPKGFRGKSLLAACRERPEAFSSVFLAIYTEGLGEKGARLWEDVRQGAQPPIPGVTTSDFRRCWGYQFAIPENAWLIDLDCRNPKKPKVWGCAQATGLVLPAEEEEALTIALRRPVRIGGKRLPIAAEEKAYLVATAGRIIKKFGDGLVQLTDAMKIIDSGR